LWKIKQEMGSFQACLEGDRNSWQSSSLSAPIQAAIMDSRRKADPLALLDKLVSDDIKICCVEDDEYPDLLQSIFDPPYLFYYHGDIQIVKGFCMAVVGSRAASNYGRVQARRFGNELAQQGIVVVSGMARGIDTESHQGALEAGGKTAAVLGSGLNVVYPPENKKLYNSICEQGLMLSEFPPDAHPEPGNFPARNRTISGLSRGVLVVEAKQRSGALITADFALEQGRDVFAIPGPINSKNSAGTNYLIKQGACLVSDVQDILAEYGLNDKEQEPHTQQGELSFERDPEEILVLELIGHETVHFDNLLDGTELNIGRLSTVLLKMELKGIIRAMPGNYYVKI
jgi:DNA processing protein